MSHFLIGTIASAIGALILAATGSPPPDLAGVAAIITALIGVAGFFASLWRGKANNKRVEEVEQAASYVKGFDALIKRLQEEIASLKGEMTQERAKWAKEQEELMRTIAALRTELQDSISHNTASKAELMELRGQIRGFLTQQQYEEFKRHAE